MKPSNEYHTLQCLINQTDYESVLAILCEYHFLGAQEIEHDNTIEIISSFASSADLEKAKKKLTQSISTHMLKSFIIENQNWNKEWIKHMTPVKITDHIWASPKWLSPPLQKNDLWIKIEPEMVFGSGHHETTRLASHMIEQSRSHIRQNFLDIGTGSGILSFIAAAIGFSHSIGLEIDPAALSNLIENLKDNPSQNKIHFIIGSIFALQKKEYFSVVAMNMIRSHSEPLLSHIYPLLSKSGYLIWSGILTKESHLVIAAAESKKFKLLYEKTENEWWGGIFEKK